MTLEQTKQLHCYGVGTCNKVPTPFIPSQVCPPTQDVTPRVASPSGSPTFNSLSINDVRFMSQFKDCDPLHLPDKVARVQQRGKALSKFAKSVGANSFVQTYFKK